MRVQNIHRNHATGWEPRRHGTAEPSIFILHPCIILYNIGSAWVLCFRAIAFLLLLVMLPIERPSDLHFSISFLIESGWNVGWSSICKPWKLAIVSVLSEYIVCVDKRRLHIASILNEFIKYNQYGRECVYHPIEAHDRRCIEWKSRALQQLPVISYQYILCLDMLLCGFNAKS